MWDRLPLGTLGWSFLKIQIHQILESYILNVGLLKKCSMLLTQLAGCLGELVLFRLDLLCKVVMPFLLLRCERLS